MRLLAALVLLVASALAAPKAPRCVRDAKTALEIARTRGKLIFLTVIVDNDGENRMVIDSVFRDRSFIKISREFVCLLANPHDQHGKVAVKDEKTGKRVHRCADCPSISCLDHQNLAQNFARAFFPNNMARTPVHFVINQDEEVVATIKNGDFETGFNHVAAKVVVTELRKILKKFGRGLSEVEYQGMLEHLTDARAARARKNVTLELEKLNAVAGLNRDVVGVREARARIKEIDKIAAGGLNVVAKEIESRQFEDALRRLDQLARTYPGTLTAGAAQLKRKELLKRSDVKKLLKAAGYYAKGVEYKRKGKIEQARRKFNQALRTGKGTKYAGLARKELDALGAGNG